MKNPKNYTGKFKTHITVFLKFALIGILFFFNSLSVLGQDYYLQDSVTKKTEKLKIEKSFSKNTVSIDGGIMFLIVSGWVTYSANYECLLIKGDYNLMYARIGFGYAAYGTDAYSYEGLQIPVTMNVLYGKDNNHFEVDFGGRFVYDNYRNFKPNVPDSKYKPIAIFPIVNIGYRYQRPKGGVFFKSLIGIDGLTLGLGYAF